MKDLSLFFGCLFSFAALSVVSAEDAAVSGRADVVTSLRKAVATPMLPAKAGFTSFTFVFNELEAADAAADMAWRKLGSVEEYDVYRKTMHDRYVDAIGGFPARTPLNAKVTATIRRDSYRVDKVLFESMPGVYVTGLLYLPDESKFKPPYKAYVVLCGHSVNGKGSKDYQRGCVLGAEAGMAAFIIDPIGQGERIQVPTLGNTNGHNLFGVNALLVGKSMAGYRLWDAIRALDYFDAREDIRHDGYGVMGNSGGGTMTSLLCAVESRIVAAAPACYISSIREVVQHEGPQDAEQNIFGQLAFGLNHASFVLMGGNAVRMHCCHNDFFPFYGSRETYRVVSDTIRNCHLGENRYGLTDVPGPHGWKESTRTSSVQWMRRWLNGERDALPIDVEACRLKDIGFDVGKVDYGIDDYNVTADGSISKLSGFRSVYEYLRDDLDAALKTRKIRSLPETSEMVRRQAGIRTLAEIPVAVKEISRVKEGQYELVRTAFHFAGGLDVPTVTIVPDAVSNGPVLLVGDGKREELMADAVSYLNEGHPVMLADLLATGEICQLKHRFYGAKNEDEEVAVILYMLGKSLVGVRAEELVVLSDFLKTRFGASVHVVAKGRIAIPAAHAHAVSPELVSRVTTIDPPPSWTEYVRTSCHPCPYANAVNAALLNYDWTDLLPKRD